ncbi:poly [ADP-ribose] polymerase [Papilio machaon]|uniref:poly [ADP-ribose] polymerase n=1 Tax=Papilio machaon TaxID=76193 RepID=UPI001E662ED2|nr:poly [ADP-ribose] polymerase [Papilio machaon]XP_045534441.1 poly [ADP-ribose] polymerase [Papilio machaon]XP_045534442.1 poly [ADP-ribose] polymerase [Papilio machaon]
MTDLPYSVEYAKSSRASCKLCKNTIDQGTLRIALMVQSPFFDGKQPNWHHLDCLFSKKPPTAISEIANFNKIKHEDQEAIKKKISGEDKGTKRGKNKKNGAMPYTVEYSKSSRATCRHCDIKICKDEIRVAKIDYDPKYGDHPLWHHVKCFAEKKVELNFLGGGEELPGFKSLKKEDQNIVKQEIRSSEGDEVPIKKIKKEPKEEEDVKAEAELKKQLVKQSKLYDKSKDALSQFTKNELHELLQANDQDVLTGRDECLNHLADCMAFGVPEPCPECKQGQLVLDTFYYKCTGDMNEWTKCMYKSKDPKKKKMVVPPEYKKHSAFAKYKPKVTTRIFESEPPPPPTIVKKEEPMDISKPKPIAPLKNLQFFLLGKFKSSKEEVKNRILKLGGLVVSKITDTTAAAVSSKNEVKKMSAKMEELREKDIEVVEETFLDLIDPKEGTILDTLRLIRENNIADWGTDPSKRIPQDVLDGKSIQKSGSQYVKSKSGITKLKVKGGTAVDPDSGLEDVAHVYKDGDGTKYTIVLSKTDVVEQKNSYYKLQVLEADNKKKYWLFRSWGRIGTPIGGNKVENCSSLLDAINKFEGLYMERTQNPWDARDHFMKMPGAYFPIDMDYGDEQTSAALVVDTVKCKLPVPVQKLIMHIFDINIMKQTLMEFELDTDKMPLGKLSKKQIKSGYNVLSELLKYLNEGKANENKIVDATNRFYTLVPHNFGTDNPPLLNNAEAIKSKTEMLDNLLEIEIAYNLLKSEDDDDKSVSPIETHYIKLKTEISPLDVKSPEYELILEYMRNTHAETHSSYTLDIESAFKVIRDGEEKRFKPFKKLHNRRLLWHGSRVTNFAGILSQGLRIAPPEAPVTGYMFGKGIYFADMVSKSANYCCTNKANPLGIIMLCEVALGDMKKCHQAEYITKLPSGKHATWGVGRTQPDPARARTLPDGTLVPLGPPVSAEQNTALLYNEFIVYDVAQVKAKYVLQVKFNYKF